MDELIKDIKINYGPSIFAPHKAVTAFYSRDIFGNDLNVSDNELKKLWSILPDIVMNDLKLEAITSVNELLVTLIKSFLYLKGDLDLNIDVKFTLDGRQYISIEYINDITATLSLKAAFTTISYIKSAAEKPSAQLSQHLNNVLHNIISNSPGVLIQCMYFAAKKQNIPYFAIEAAGSLFSYGQGNKSVFFNHASSQYDSVLGTSIQKDKIQTNFILKINGYPVTEQKQITTFAECQKAINEIGFPVVIKPISLGRGKGVTANIRTIEQAEIAYREADKNAPGEILIENFIEGNDHRITVSQGKVNGISCRSPASVIGDGTSSIQTLIEQENKHRLDAIKALTAIKTIDIDDLLIQVLRDNNLTLNSIADVGQLIILRNNSNLSTGGTLTLIDIGDAHPDNLEMAVEIAKVLRLDSLGIDFITPDIKKSWRNIGAIIEVNTFPMLSQRLADGLLENQFSNNNNGRIDTFLIVTNDQKFSREIFNAQQDEQKYNGFTDAHYTSLNNGEITAVKDILYDRCLSLLINPDCTGIMIAMSPEEIIQDGLPIDFFDNCIIDLKCGFHSEHINNVVKTTNDVNNLEQWLKQFIGQVKKQ